MVRHAALSALEDDKPADDDGGEVHVAQVAIWRRPRTLAIVIPGVVTALLGAYILSLPNALNGIHGPAAAGVGYDEGVYFGAAIRLIHGSIPYQDFALLHPPGIAVLLTPIAVLSELIGTQWALVVIRILTLVAAALNASLVALAVRHRGPAAMFIAGLLFSLFPLAVGATHTLSLEVYILLFCLLGVNLAFIDGQLAPSRRLAMAGACFGLACAIKLTVVPVLLAAIVVMAVKHRRPALTFAGAAAAVVALLFLPFLAVAPGAFIRDVFEVQSQRSLAGDGVTGLIKLTEYTGLGAFPVFANNGGFVIVATLVFVAYLAYRFRTQRTHFTICDWQILAGTAAAIASIMLIGQYGTQYSYFPFAWIAMTVAIIVAPADSTNRWPAIRAWSAQRKVAVAILSALALVVFVLDARHAREFMAGSYDVAAVIRATTPPGSCVVSVDVITVTILSERFNSDNPDCPAMIDPFGTWVADTVRHTTYKGVYPEEFVVEWGNILSATDYVAMVAPKTNFVPWAPELDQWFQSNFTEIAHTDKVVVYRHSKRTPPPASIPSIGAQKSDDLVSVGIKMEQSGNANDALANYLAAIQANPDNKFAHFDAGHVFQSRGEDAKAEEEYLTALRIDPNFVQALFNMGVLRTGPDPVSAMDFFRRVLAIEPDQPVANFNLGVIMIHSGDPSGGGFIQRGIALQPNLARAVPADIPMS